MLNISLRRCSVSLSFLKTLSLEIKLSLSLSLSSHLRPVRQPLRQRIQSDKRQSGNPDHDRARVELREHAGAGGELRGEERGRPSRADRPSRQRAGGRPRDLSVELPVPEVVDGTSCASQQQGADAKEEEEVSSG